MKYLHIRITELPAEQGISKTRICKDLDLQRGDFYRYCRDDFQRVDAALIVKLCNSAATSANCLRYARSGRKIDKKMIKRMS